MRWNNHGRAATSSVSINFYGYDHSSSTIGATLTSSKLFLQPLDLDPRSLPYDNPQDLKLPNVAQEHISNHSNQAADHGIEDKLETSTIELESVFDHIPLPAFLEEAITDQRICTTLLKHQKEAISFIQKRESGDLPEFLSLWHSQEKTLDDQRVKHTITGSLHHLGEDILGGFLADDMGLGKTLSMLAVIVGSLGQALQFALDNTKSHPDQWHSAVPSKSTLVIVPSSLLLDSWETEIKMRLTTGAISFYRYHSHGRQTSIAELLQHDVILTTYATVSAGFCRDQSILHRVRWYRIVLDEAHIIRNSTTKQFRAIHALNAQIRWCLTGTPIQNSLDDLGTLVRFLRVPLLEDPSVFRRFIMTPILSGAVKRFENIRRLLESLCLRRTKLLLNLPEPSTETHVLDLSKRELQLYRHFGERCRRAIDLAVSGHSMKKANQHVIQMILAMRLFCNTGEEALKQRSGTFGIPTDPDEALTYLQTCNSTECVRCDTDIATMYQVGDQSSGSFTICGHLVCGECVPRLESELVNTLDESLQCSVCAQHCDRDTYIVRKPDLSRTSRPVAKTYTTKLFKLLDTVKAQTVDDRSIVFSFWKTTLDMVASLFDKHGVKYLRIHGSIPVSRRSNVLSQFETSDTHRVLLITLGTGAVGLNRLRVANHVHILEPQWNPSVESQAIGRILRLGQTKSVKIVRYIMKDTVEAAVQSRQLRKLQLARGGFGLSRDEHTTRRVDEIMNLLCPTIADRIDADDVMEECP